MADTGADTRVTYLWEDNGYLQTPNDSTDKTFGANARLTVAEGSRAAVQVVDPGSDLPADTIEQMFDGAWGVQFELTNAYWLRFIFGAPTTTGSGPYTHTYSGISATPARIIEGYEGNDHERQLMGCVLSQCQIQPAVNQNVRVTLRGPYGKERLVDQSGGGGIRSQVATSYRTMTFAQALLAVDATTESLAQDASLALPLNAQLIPAFNSNFAADFWHPTLRPQLDFSSIKDAGDTTHLVEMYGGALTMSEKVTDKDPATLTFDNKETGTDANKLTISLTGTVPNSYGEDGSGDPDALIRQRINRMVEGVSATYENNTATAP